MVANREKTAQNVPLSPSLLWLFHPPIFCYTDKMIIVQIYVHQWLPHSILQLLLSRYGLNSNVIPETSVVYDCCFWPVKMLNEKLHPFKSGQLLIKHMIVWTHLPKLAGKKSRKASFRYNWVKFNSCENPSGSLRREKKILAKN